MILPAEIIDPYLPGLVLRRFSGLSGAGRVGPALTRVDAAVLFTDISGFTPLAESLARRGRGGVEELSRLLNAYYGPLIEEIVNHGGDVAKMAGDALVAVWPVDSGDSLARVTLRAAQCAHAVQARMSNYELGDGVRLALKAAVAAGEIRVLHVGGVLDRWEMLIGGDPLAQMTGAEKKASPGDVVLSPQAWQLVVGKCRGILLPGGFVTLERVERPVPMAPVVRPGVSDEFIPSLWGYVSGAIRTRLEAGQAGWLSELRRVTVLFVKLPSLDEGGDDALERAERVMRAIQESLYGQEGSVNKLNVDDKGITLVAALGLPPLAHGDDPARGALAGLAIRDALARLGERCSIGITTGQAYCGEVGGSLRREYTMIGDVVNLSARLMQASSGLGDILCDEATATAARSRLEFEPLPPIRVKGKADPIPVYRPKGPNLAARRSRPLFGRDPERAAIAWALEDVSSGRGGLLVIEGDAGLGKSGLILDTLRVAETLGVSSLVASADPIESNTPYFAWRPILASLLRIDDLADPEARRSRVREKLGDFPEIEPMLPLLNDVLGLDLPATDVTTGMTGEVRADNTRDLLLRIIRDASESGPLAIILEDAHWLDATSWGLAAAVVQGVPRVLLIVSTRPLADRPEVANTLIDSPAAIHLRLAPLTAPDLIALACDQLDVNALPEEIASILISKVEGNPLHAEELALSLRESGLIVVEGETCKLAPGVVPEEIALPDSMRGAILGRIDRLGPSQQLTLKSASVIGRLFQARTLHAIYPIESERSKVGEDLSALGRLDFTHPDPLAQDDHHAFKHVITREVAYDLMLLEQRKALHRDVALWYEHEAGPDLGPYFPLLAHHWDRASEAVRAVEYLDRAGERALLGGSYREAADFFTRGLTIEARSGQITPFHAARREQALGDCHLALGDLAQSRVHTGKALSLLGAPIPEGRVRQVASLAVQIGRQLYRRAWPAPSRSVSDDDRSAALRASSAYAVIGQLCYFDQDLPLGVLAAMKSLNLAEAVSPSPQLARAYATVSVAASLVPLFTASAYYAKKARETAAQIDDLQAKAWVLELVGITELNVCRWSSARECLEEAIRIADRINDRRRWSEAVGELARLEMHRGEFSKARDLFASQFERACRHGDDQARTWGLHGQALNCLRMGRDAEALALLKESPALRNSSAPLADAILGGGLIAVAHFRLGDREAARREAEATVRRIGNSRPMVGYNLDGYAGAADVLLSLGSEDTARCASDACASLRKFARVFPIGRPRAYLLSGREDWSRGRHRRAIRAWSSALKIAEQHDMPYERALAHEALGTHHPDRVEAGPSHLARAREIFDRIGAGPRPCVGDDREG